MPVTSVLVELFLVFSMYPFAVNDCLDAMQHAGYQRFIVLLAYFSDTHFLDCMPQVLSA